ncbi:MAG: hypothetical protein KDK97_20245 [Verrucomicrobiales bacterium]|nr:hypothetical protein [Verrucomicrobiales bacterium]
MKTPLTRSNGRAMLGTYDPALPTDGSLIVANVLRDQFNGLADMIAAIQTITSAQVDGVTTLNPGNPATVSASIAAGVLHLSFGIPQGDTGEQGPPGEVSQGDLENAINYQTSNNTNAVSTLGTYVSDPPTQGEVQAIVDKLDELINALKR